MPDPHRFTTEKRNLDHDGTISWGGDTGWSDDVASSENVSFADGSASPNTVTVLATADFAGNTYDSSVWRKDDSSYSVWQDPANSEFTNDEWRVDGNEVSGNLVYDSAVPDAGVALETDWTYRGGTNDGAIWTEAYSSGSRGTGVSIYFGHYRDEITVTDQNTGTQYTTSYSGPWTGVTWRTEFDPANGVTLRADGTAVHSPAFTFPTNSNECAFYMSTGQGGVTLEQDNLKVKSLP